MKNKLNLAIVCGGRSFEYPQSISSTLNIANLLDNDYKVTILCIDRKGDWFYGHKDNIIFSDKITDVEFDFTKAKKVEVLRQGRLYSNDKIIDTIDKVLIITNGMDGQQGAISGMMKLLDIPCVGSDMLKTVICADKEITKSLLQNNGLPIVPYLMATKNKTYSFEEVVNKLGLPFVVKPSQLGCSAGVSKVESEKEYVSSINEAFTFDTKILIEKYIKGREIEIGMIEHKHKILSPHIAEVTAEFYCFEEKFVSQKNNTICPAQLSIDLEKKLRQIGREVFTALDLKFGFYRLDFFVEDDKIYINEINTFPFFTAISLFPKMWGKDLKKEMIHLIQESKI